MASKQESFAPTKMKQEAEGDTSKPMKLKIATVNTKNGCNILPKLSNGPNKNQHQLMLLLNKMDQISVKILGIGQTHWMGEGIFKLIDGQNDKKFYMVAHCGESDTAYRGVAIVLSPDLQRSIARFDFVSSRMVAVDLRVANGFYTVVQVFAPRKNNVQLEHENFCNQLKSFLTSKFQNGSEKVLVMGDFDFIEFPKDYGNRFIGRNFRVLKAQSVQKSKNLVLTYCTTNNGHPYAPTVEFESQFSSFNRSVLTEMSLNICSSEHYSGPIARYAYKIISSNEQLVSDGGKKIYWQPEYVRTNNQPSAARASIIAADPLRENNQPVVKNVTSTLEILQRIKTLCESCFDSREMSNRFSADFHAVSEADQGSADGFLNIHLCVDPFGCVNPQTIGVEFIELSGKFYCRIKRVFVAEKPFGNLFATIKDFCDAATAGNLATKIRETSSRIYWGGMLIGKNLRRMTAEE